jgi:hypothetical protein
MNNIEHMHRLNFSWWIGNLIIGSFLLLIAIGTLIFNFQDLVSGILGVADYLGIIIVIVFIFPAGLLLFIIPFVTKIVVKAHGVEYHTPTCVFFADWKDLVNIGHVKDEKVGKSLLVISRGGNLILRKWAQPFQKIIKHNPKDVQILVSQFSASNGHSLETDILVNVSQRGQFSATELESL